MKVLAYKIQAANLNNEAYLIIYVQRANVLSAKSLEIHATTDEWRTVQKLNPQYGFSSLRGRIVQKCKFAVSLPKFANELRCCFAVYDPMTETWDNNDGWNHSIALGNDLTKCLICCNSSDKLIIPKCFHTHTYCQKCCARMNYSCPLCKKSIQ